MPKKFHPLFSRKFSTDPLGHHEFKLCQNAASYLRGGGPNDPNKVYTKKKKK